MAVPPARSGAAAPGQLPPATAASPAVPSVIPPPAQADAVESIRLQIKLIGDAVKGARYALEPPRTAPQARDAARVPRLAKATVTEEWVQSSIAAMQRIAGDPRVPGAQRAEANVIAAGAEGLIVKHFTTFFWNKVEPGRRAINDLRAAIAEDPKNEAAAIAYTFTLMGIRGSGFRGKAEDTMGLKTTPELERVIPLLAAHRDSLMSQTLLGPALSALETDGPLPPDLARLRDGLESRVAQLRGRDALVAEEVDDQMQQFTK